MNISKVTCVFFSATGLTQKVADLFLSGLPVAAEKLNLTPYTSGKAHVFGPDELVVFAAPVYGGILPAPAAERFALLKGQNTPAVCLAVYGNRDYDDALLEMKNLVQNAGFVPVAFGAPVAQHSLMPRVAAGRPDKEDAEHLQAFARQVWEKLGDLTALCPQAVPQVPGNFPYKKFGGVPFKPQVSKACVHCGACAAHCPVGAIPKNAPDTTDKSACIACMACIKICPSHARSITPKGALWLAEKAFLLKYGKRRDLEVFI